MLFVAARQIAHLRRREDPPSDVSQGEGWLRIEQKKAEG
jgi:hypothetical protein